MRRVLLLALTALFGCVKDRPATGSASAAPSETAPLTSATSTTPTSTIDAAPASAPLAGLVVSVPAPGHFTIEATRETSVATVARLERKTASGWQALENLDLGTGYRLVETCPPRDTAAPRCTTIAAGKTLAPVPWQGFGCSAQCNGTCRANTWEGPGTFRLLVSACDGGAATESPTFELPDPSAAGREAFGRWGVAAGITRATVVRLVLEGATREAVPLVGKDRVFGFRAVPASERPLADADVQALATLLRAPKGFDDTIQKRCAMKTLVGFRLERSVPSTGTPRAETTELAIDFNCAKLFAVRGEGTARTVLASHFDPSRAAFLALAKRALPDDKEVAATR